jgi:hypothetical protein
MSIHWGGRGAGHVSRWSTATTGVPALALDFLQPFLDSRITFSRGTGATRVNASGFIETVGNTTPRFDYDPVTLAPRGLLIEEARTNLVLRSEELNGSSWFSYNALVSADATAAPSGLTVADKITEASGSSLQSRYAGFTSAFTTVTASMYFKSAERTFAHMSVSGTGLTQWFSATFNLATGVITQQNAGAAGTITRATITNAGNGWYRCTITGVTGAASGSTYIYFGPSNAATPTPGSYGVLTYTGTAGSGIFAWGAQFEAAAFATSYIPTVASAVTRNADIATMTGTNFSTWYNQSEGTFVTAASQNAAIATNNRILSANDGSVNESFQVSFANNSTSGYGEIRDGGSAVAAILTGTFAATTIARMAFGSSLNDAALSVNGGAVGTDNTVTMPTVDRLNIGSNAGGANVLNGHVRAIVYYKKRLLNAQLQALTL